MAAAPDEAGLRTLAQPPATEAPLAAPLVSIVVRSMGRPHLAAALACLAAQDHPALDVIVVDATGGAHPPLPDIDWRHGHRVRLLEGTRRLNRTEAANAGLDAVEGAYFGYLDDDDACEPTHVSTLVRGAQAHPDALAVYGRAQWLRPDGTVERLHGLPFNRMLLFHGPLMCWQAALFRREVIALGCRFRAEFDRMEDRDFVAQVADRGELVMIDAATFRFRPDLGTSGTGTGGNDARGRSALIDLRLRNAWYGSGTFHTVRASRFSQRAIACWHDHRVEDALRLFEAALVDYPEDPNALNGVARILLGDGELDEAEDYARRAIAVRSDADYYRETLALIRAARGGNVVRFPREQARPAPLPPTPGRLDPCPCGSGVRFKHCCGRPKSAAPGLRPVVGPERTPDALLERARAVEAQGSADAGRVLCDLAAIALEDGHDDLALDLAARALDRGDAARARRLFELAGARSGRADRERSLLDFARRLLAERRPSNDWRQRALIVGDLSEGSLDRAKANEMLRELPPPERFAWSVKGLGSPPLEGPVTVCHLDSLTARILRDSPLLLLPGALPPGDWLDLARPEAVVLHYNGDPESLVTGLAQVDCVKPTVPLAAWPEP